MITNYHTHTTRCRHASGSDREYIEAAIKAGIRTLGFSDHVPYPYPDGYISGIRMLPSEAEDYISSLTSLRAEYQKEIQIFIGFEAEYVPSLWNSLCELLAPYDFDYFILGQHFLYTENSGIYSSRPTDREDYLEEYVNEVIAAIRTGQFSCIAHPDLFYYTGPDEIYLKHMRRLCTEAALLQIPLELNLNGLSNGRNYPDRRFFALAKSIGNTVLLGRDAHQPGAFADTDTLNRSLAFLQELNISPMEYLTFRNPKQ